MGDAREITPERVSTASPQREPETTLGVGMPRRTKLDPSSASVWSGGSGRAIAARG